MARIFITGSSDGLGSITANLLIGQGHEVILHARNPERAKFALEKVPGAKGVLIADLSSDEETRHLAAEVNANGYFNTIIHNAGVYDVPNKQIYSVNTLAPYILTCLIQRPERLIYLSSGLHWQGDPKLVNLSGDAGRYTYSDSKLHILILAKAVARKWPGVFSNAVNPGWVPTKMGGRNAPDDLLKGAETQAWLAVSKDKEAMVSGKYFFHMSEKSYLPVADKPELQNKYLDICEKVTGVRFPG